MMPNCDTAGPRDAIVRKFKVINNLAVYKHNDINFRPVFDIDSLKCALQQFNQIATNLQAKAAPIVSTLVFCYDEKKKPRNFCIGIRNGSRFIIHTYYVSMLELNCQEVSLQDLLFSLLSFDNMIVLCLDKTMVLPGLAYFGIHSNSGLLLTLDYALAKARLLKSLLGELAELPPLIAKIAGQQKPSHTWIYEATKVPVHRVPGHTFKSSSAELGICAHHAAFLEKIYTAIIADFCNMGTNLESLSSFLSHSDYMKLHECVYSFEIRNPAAVVFRPKRILYI